MKILFLIVLLVLVSVISINDAFADHEQSLKISKPDGISNVCNPNNPDCTSFPIPVDKQIVFDLHTTGVYNPLDTIKVWLDKDNYNQNNEVYAEFGNAGGSSSSISVIKNGEGNYQIIINTTNIVEGNHRIKIDGIQTRTGSIRTVSGGDGYVVTIGVITTPIISINSPSSDPNTTIEGNNPDLKIILFGKIQNKISGRNLIAVTFTDSLGTIVYQKNLSLDTQGNFNNEFENPLFIRDMLDSGKYSAKFVYDSIVLQYKWNYLSSVYIKPTPQNGLFVLPMSMQEKGDGVSTSGGQGFYQNSIARAEVGIRYHSGLFPITNYKAVGFFIDKNGNQGQNITVTLDKINPGESKTLVFINTVPGFVSQFKMQMLGGTLVTETPDVVPPTDTDKDGIPDSTDKCPTQAETVNGYQDTDGCPDVVPPKDTDSDGIPDSSDSCPTQAETVNGYQDTDGCPDVVPIKDTIPPVIVVPNNMAIQATSNNPSPVTFSVSATDDKDGTVTPTCLPKSGSNFAIGITTVSCTVTDNAGNTATKSFTVTVTEATAKDTDKDGISDSTDKCPTQAETINGFQDTDGCPDKSLTPDLIKTCGVGTYLVNGACEIRPDQIKTSAITLTSAEPKIVDSNNRPVSIIKANDSVFVNVGVENLGKQTEKFVGSYRYIQASTGKWSEWTWVSASVNAGKYTNISIPWSPAMKDSYEFDIQIWDNEQKKKKISSEKLIVNVMPADIKKIDDVKKSDDKKAAEKKTADAKKIADKKIADAKKLSDAKKLADAKKDKK